MDRDRDEHYDGAERSGARRAGIDRVGEGAKRYGRRNFKENVATCIIGHLGPFRHHERYLEVQFGNHFEA